MATDKGSGSDLADVIAALRAAGLTDIYIGYDYLWRNVHTGQPQTALDPQNDPQDWIRLRRRFIRARTNYKEMTE